MKKLLALFSVLLLSFVLLGATEANAAANLLINGSGEEGMLGWTDNGNAEHPEGLWKPSTLNTNHTAIDGDTFFWPSKNYCKYACMYQDVDVSGYSIGTWLSLSAWLANYDQYPHDQATIKIQILDLVGNVIYEDYSLQRNPDWQYHQLSIPLPTNAVTARVLCIADRYVGSDNDAYFDDIRLTTIASVSEVTITGDKSKVKPGDTIQLKASDGKYKKASDYDWSSSYDAIATVDENGLVTMVADPGEDLLGAEVYIFAMNKETGVIGKYYINSERENIGASASDNGSGSQSSESKISKPEKVKSLKVVSVKIQWDKSKGANGYYVYKYDKTSGKYKLIKTIRKGTTTSYTISNLKLNNTYKFKVAAYKTVNGKKVRSEDSQILTISLK